MGNLASGRMMGPWAASIDDDCVVKYVLVLGRVPVGDLRTFSADAVHRNVVVRVARVWGLRVADLLGFIHFF